MSRKDKTEDRDREAREYAEKLRGGDRPPPGPPPELADQGEDPPDPAALGLALFTDTGTDIVDWTPERRQEAMASGYTMLERYLSLAPGKGCQAFILGWSAGLLPALEDPSRLRYTRRLHLELRSGARVSMLEAAQIASLFAVPMDGSCAVDIYKGGESIRNGRRMGHWEVLVKLGARKPQHEAGKAYVQIAAEAQLRDKLGTMTTTELSRILAAPPGLVDAYLEQARKREVDVEIARRAAAVPVGTA